MVDPRIVWIIVSVVSAAWLTLTIASVFRDDVEMPPALSALFMAIAGAALAQLRHERPKSDKPDDTGQLGSGPKDEGTRK